MPTGLFRLVLPSFSSLFLCELRSSAALRETDKA